MPIGQTITRRRERVFFCRCHRHEDGPPHRGHCPAHAADLARIAGEFEAEGGWKSGDGAKVRPSVPTCQTPGCFMPRTPPLPVCRDYAEPCE